jgi:hypothetical protein
MKTKFANQYRKSRNHYPPRGGLLDNGQKARIAILAKEAFDRQGCTGSIEDWRHEQQFLAVGKESLRDCVQDDYLKLKAHFEDLTGESGRAVKTHMADAVSDRELVMRKLEAECAARALDISYPATICAKQYKCDLDHASPNQLWQLVFTVRNRRKRIKTEAVDQPF